MTVEITKENFESVVLKNELPVLVDFWATWCGPCKMIGPIIEELSEELEGKVVFGKLNVDLQPELAMEFIKDMRAMDKTILESRFNISIDEEDENLEVLEKICQSRRFLVKGGDYDYDRGCLAIVSDFKQGKMGNITLESVGQLKLLIKKDNKREDK